MNQELIHVQPAPVIAMDRGEELLRLAVEKGADVGTLERLMAMRRELRAEQAKEAFDQAMADFQRECPPIVKSEAVHQKNSTAVRYKYAPLDVIIAQTKDLIHKHRFSYKVDAKISGSMVLATCEVKHALGHSQTSSMEVPIDPDAYMNQQQKFASAFTFAKRYAFCSAFGIVTADQDDDAQGAGNSQKREPPKMPQDDSGGIKTPPQAQSHAPSKPQSQTTSKIASATPETRQKLIESLTQKGMGGLAVEYFQKLQNPAVLMPNEDLSNLDLRFVPTTQKQFEALLEAITDFGDGAEAKHAFPPHDLAAGAPRTTDPAAVPQAGAAANSPAAAPPASDLTSTGEEWRRFPLPFGKDAGTALEDLDKKKLFGWWCNFKVETEYNGRSKKKETIAKDQKFREMLDQAGSHYGFKV